MMNKRLIWNFEISVTDAPALSTTFAPTEEKNRWEARYFWPETQIILLQGLSESFLNLSQYKYKQRKDTYLILSDRQYNLKCRRNKVLYKPIIQKGAFGTQYGRKIKYDSVDLLSPPEEEPLNQDDFIAKIKKDAIPCEMLKEAVIYQFPGTPKIMLEFSRIVLHQKIYHSLSIESRSLQGVRSISHTLIGVQKPTNYIDFIKSHLE